MSGLARYANGGGLAGLVDRSSRRGRDTGTRMAAQVPELALPPRILFKLVKGSGRILMLVRGVSRELRGKTPVVKRSG